MAVTVVWDTWLKPRAEAEGLRLTRQVWSDMRSFEACRTRSSSITTLQVTSSLSPAGRMRIVESGDNDQLRGRRSPAGKSY
jgi:hypothetical protein